VIHVINQSSAGHDKRSPATKAFFMMQISILSDGKEEAKKLGVEEPFFFF